MYHHTNPFGSVRVQSQQPVNEMLPKKSVILDALLEFVKDVVEHDLLSPRNPVYLQSSGAAIADCEEKTVHRHLGPLLCLLHI